MSKEKSTKDILLEHSKAKVKLFERYLSIYLNILDRAGFIRNIILADLFAGEGIYKNGEKGSPIIAFETIQRHLTNKKDDKKIYFIINDAEKSKIDSSKYKVERIEEWINQFDLHSDLNIKYLKHDFIGLIPALINLIKSMHSSDRALLFIDPWGYKEIRPRDLKSLLQNEKVEILLFLPVSFMYRFSKKAITTEFVGGQPLEEFLQELFGEDLQSILEITAVDDYIDVIRTKFMTYLNVPYVDDYILTTEDSNKYCLFFFSFNKKGFRKIIEAKWSLDKEYGRGVNREENFNLFSGAHSNEYENKLIEYIFTSEGRTNEQLLDFGFENRFLPKHTREILNKLLKEGKIKIVSLDGLEAKNFYIDNEKRKVLVKKV